MELIFRGSTLKTLLFKKFRGEIQLFTSDLVRRSLKLPFEPRHDWSLRSRIREEYVMARNLRQVHDLTPTRVRESTVVADFAEFADVNMHAPPAFIMLSRKRNQEFLFQGVDLEVTFLEFFCPSGPLRATSFFVCLRRLCLRRSPGVTQVLRLSLSLSHSLPLPSQIRAVSTFLLVWFVSKRVRESRGFVESKHELQRY